MTVGKAVDTGRGSWSQTQSTHFHEYVWGTGGLLHLQEALSEGLTIVVGGGKIVGVLAIDAS